MACENEAKAGVKFCFEITPTNVNDVSLTVNGSAVVPDTLTDIGGGVWEVCIAAVDMVAPGPLVATEGETELYCAKIVP